MPTRLEIAKQKLARLDKEFESATQGAYAHMRQANGQPMNDKRGGAAFFAKRDQKEQKVFNVLHEIEAQKERIERLEHQQLNRDNHLTASGGLKTSVQNIDALKERKQTADTRRKVKLLEDIASKAEQDQQAMSDRAKQLIASGTVSKWEAKPIYYFVKKLRKVALVIDADGNFAPSKKYPPKSEQEEQTLKDLLEATHE